MFPDSRISLLAAGLVLGLSATPFVSADDAPRTPAKEAAGQAEKLPEGLKERVLGYWRAKIDGRAETAYGYVSPGMRKILTYKQFLRQMKGVGRWKSVKFLRAQCDGERCDATVEVEIRMRLPQFPQEIHTVSPVTERWFRKDGKWWILIES